MSTLNTTLGFIGAGNMARSIIMGLIKCGVSPHLITASNPSGRCLDGLAKEYNIQTTRDNEIAASHSDVLILAVKPHIIPDVLQTLKSKINPSRHLVISIASGICLKDLSESLPQTTPVVRAMPNTPAQVGYGLTCCIANKTVTSKQRDLTQQLFEAVGTALWLKDDEALNKAAAIAGCGPAYFFYMMESLLAVAEEWGFESEVGKILTANTALGAAQLYTQAHEKPSDLRRAVTSPGGMTAAAIECFDNHQMKTTIITAIKAAYERAIALSKKLR